MLRDFDNKIRSLVKEINKQKENERSMISDMRLCRPIKENTLVSRDHADKRCQS